jgi:ubiquinone/menaquinone biosynthesis C-methylase UbiE
MSFITPDDFIETWQRIRQRGLKYIVSKFNPNATARTRSTFNEAAIESSNWWIIPAVKARWNEKISGNGDTLYEDYTVQTHLKDKSGLKMLSLGSGVCSHEIRFAQHPQFALVKCMDISEIPLQTAKKQADALGLTNMEFEATDVNKLKLTANQYDVILFHSSLHHFLNVEKMLTEVIKPALTPNGILVMHEYVGPARLQWTNTQLQEINRILKHDVPQKYKQRFMSNLIKNHVYGPGSWRMVLTDPSEAVESDKIIPALHKHFTVIEEKALGGNILMPLLKDIAHNFLKEDEETTQLLHHLFELEDRFLEKEQSHLMYGVYSC